jgi:hypothetical protein
MLEQVLMVYVKLPGLPGLGRVGSAIAQMKALFRKQTIYIKLAYHYPPPMASVAADALADAGEATAWTAAGVGADGGQAMVSTLAAALPTL